MMTPNSQFGITYAEIENCISNSTYPVYGIHVYSGTKINEFEFRISVNEINNIVRIKIKVY